MNKLKIYKNVIKKGKIVLLPLTMATAIIFNGCSLFPNAERAKYKNNKSDYTPNYSNNLTIDTTEPNSELINESMLNFDNYIYPMITIKNGNLLQSKIKFSDENFISVKNYIESTQIHYDYENLYNLPASLKEYNKLIVSDKHTDSLKNITEENLIKVIEANNKKYKENTKTVIYKELSFNEINEICRVIVATINDFIKTHEDISIDRIKCVLSDLKLFKQNSSMNNAFVTDDNCLIISPNMLKLANMMNGKGTEKDVLVHEIIHLLQKGCNCDLKKNSNLKRNFGISYGFENLKINSLDFTWLYESSAEKNMVNYTEHEPLVYENMIGYLESLSLVNILNDTYKVNDTENLSFKRNLNDLYEYFGVTNQKDKIEILNMMYSIEVMQQAPDDFYDLLEKETGQVKNDELVDEVNYIVKSSICQTLSKLFYKNLSKNIVNENVTLGDVFYMISLFEMDLNNHIKYDDSTKYNYNESFFKLYDDIQNNFFYELSLCMNCSQKEIEDKYDNYSSKIKLENNEIVNNYNLNFISKEKQKYLFQREIELNNAASISIRNAFKEILSQNIKKSVQ